MSPTVASVDVAAGRVLELPRPDRANALDRATVRDLRNALDRAAADGVRVVVIASTGRAFCAGLDLDDVRAAGESGVTDHLSRVAALLDQLRNAPYVTAAWVPGAAVGAGADLALACDYRVGTHDAWFRFPGSRFGLLLGTRHLVRVAGADRARDILLRDRRVAADEALRIGLLTSIAESEDARSAAEELGAGVADLDTTTLRRLLAATRGAGADEDQRLVSESLAVPGLPGRLLEYAAAARGR